MLLMRNYCRQTTELGKTKLQTSSIHGNSREVKTKMEECMGEEIGRMQIGGSRRKKMCIKRSRYIYCLLKQRSRLNCRIYVEVIYKKKV